MMGFNFPSDTKQKAFKAEEPHPTNTPGEFPQGNKWRILIASEEEFIHDLYEDFTGMGAEVVFSKSGFEALNQFRKGSFDLVLSDVQMPGGWTLACYIKELSPQAGVVLVMGHHRDDIMKSLREAHIDGVVFRPLESNDLQQTVQETLGRLHERRLT